MVVFNSSSLRPEQRNSKAPDNAIAAYFWRKWIWVEATFVLSMLEFWEKLLIVTLFLAFTYLVSTGVIRYLPPHLHHLQNRTHYYLFGQEGLTASEFGATVWRWVDNVTNPLKNEDE